VSSGDPLTEASAVADLGGKRRRPVQFFQTEIPDNSPAVRGKSSLSGTRKMLKKKKERRKDGWKERWKEKMERKEGRKGISEFHVARQTSSSHGHVIKRLDLLFPFGA